MPNAGHWFMLKFKSISFEQLCVLTSQTLRSALSFTVKTAKDRKGYGPS